MLKATSTKTHVQIGFANPFLKCDECKGRVPYWHDPDRCGCEDKIYNYPCKHTADITSSCPDWNSIDGCMCKTKCTVK